MTAVQRWDGDHQYQETTIAEVTKENSGWSIKRADGWSFGVPKDSPVEPVEGMIARFYGKGIGGAVRGLLLNGQEVFYRTKVEDNDYQDQQMYGRDCLDVIQRWDDGRSIWSCAMGGIGPGYEQAIQVMFIEMLRALVLRGTDPATWEKNDGQTRKADQSHVDQECSKYSGQLGLSGAQWVVAMNLAFVFYRKGPIVAVKSMVEERKILVSKNFPSLVTQPPEKQNNTKHTKDNEG